MKKIILLCLFIGIYTLNSQNLPLVNTNDYDEIVREYDEYFETKKNNNPHDDNSLKGQGWKPFKRWQYYMSSRLTPDRKIPSALNLEKNMKDYEQRFKNSKLNKINSSNKWNELGPFIKPTPIRSNPGLGRVNAIAVHPTNRNEIWVGSAGGGLWKSTNGGNSWNVMNIPGLNTSGINDINISQSNPNVVFVATGDGNGAGSHYSNFSNGLIKTTNGGLTWTRIGLNPLIQNIEQSNNYLIYRVLVSYSNPDDVYICGNIGVYRSLNGGTSWQNLSSNSCRDLEMHPTNSSILYAAFSTNQQSFLLKKLVNGQWENSADYTIPSVRRIKFATEKNFENVVYALATDLNSGFGGVFKSENSASTWTNVSPKNSHPNYLHWSFNGLNSNGSTAVGGQGWYDLAIDISPNSKDRFLIGGINIWKSNNGGTSYQLKTYQQAFGNVREVHVDHHTLYYDNFGNLWVGNDGGIYKSTDDGETYQDLTNGLSITQFYRFAQSLNNEKRIIAGAQDNGTSLLQDNQWYSVFGSDGMDCEIDYSNDNVMYQSIFYGNISRTTNGGNQWQTIIAPQATGINESAGWVTPINIDPNTPSTIYVGYQNVWKSTNRGNNWQRISNFGISDSRINIREMAIAPSNSNTMYVSIQNQLFATYNGGQSWESIYSNQNGLINYIAINPNNERDVYVAISGYASNSKVFRINNGNVTNLTYNLPNFPVNTIAIHDNNANSIYIGNDVGVFYTDNTMTEWREFGEDIPTVIITELKIHYPTGKLRAATYGRGIWEIEITDCDIERPVILSNYDINDNRIEICKEGDVELEMVGNYNSFEWSNGQKTRKINITKTGTYFVDVTDSEGCRSRSEEIEVVFYDYQEIDIMIDNDEVILCENDSLRLSYSGFYKDAEWSTGESGRSIWIKTEGDYFVKAKTNVGDCETISRTIKVILAQIPEKPELAYMNNNLISSVSADTYKWYLNDELIAEGSQYQSITPTESGDYYLEIYNENDCMNFSEIFNLEISSLLIDDNNNDIIISPNPVKDILYVNFIQQISNNVIITIQDIKGKIVYQKTNNNNFHQSLKINLDGLSSGYYNVIMLIDGIYYQHKFIKY